MPKIDFHAKFGRPNQPLLPATELSAVKSITIFLHGLVWQTKNLTPKISFWLKVDQKKKKTLPKNMSYDQSYAQKTNFSHFSFFFQFWVSLLSISIIQHLCRTMRHSAFLGGGSAKTAYTSMNWHCVLLGCFHKDFKMFSKGFKFFQKDF